MRDALELGYGQVIPQLIRPMSRGRCAQTSLPNRRFCLRLPVTLSLLESARRSSPRWAAAPATYLLVGINCLVFLSMVLRGVSILQPTVGPTDALWSRQRGQCAGGREWWRIVTAMFVHVGILHLATNMWCLWNLGLLAEPLMGSAGCWRSTSAGAAGNLLSTLSTGGFYPRLHRSGRFSGRGGRFGSGVRDCRGADRPAEVQPASGAAMELKRLRKSVIYFAAINLVIGF